MTHETAKIIDWLVFLLFSVLEPSVVSVLIRRAVLNSMRELQNLRMCSCAGEWWNTTTAGEVGAEDQHSLLIQLLFVYLDDDDQITDADIRNRLLRLHFLFLRLIQEVKFPQWYTESEICALEADFLQFARECNWLQDVMEAKGVRPGEGLNIIKFHDFLSIPGIIREFGCAMNLDTGAFERRMRFVKITNEQTRCSRADDGREHVFHRSVARDQDARYQAWKSSPAYSSDQTASPAAEMSEEGSGASDEDDVSRLGEHSDSGEEPNSEDEAERVFRFSDATLSHKHRFRKTGAWLETKFMLERGSNGPAIDVDTALASFSSGEDISLGQVSFFVQERITHVDPTTLERENRLLFPGHCVQMRDRTYAQVLLPRVLTEEDEDNEDARRALLARFDYVNPAQNNGNHPVLPIPYLKRGSCFFGRIKDIVRRSHVVPIFRPGPGNSACVMFSRTFVVNPFVFKVRRGPSAPPVCLCCPHGCPGKGVPMPTKMGSYVRCPLCARTFKWL
jgi:hypothetical protein